MTGRPGLRDRARPKRCHDLDLRGSRMHDWTGTGEVYFEFTIVGAVVRVSAVDAATGVEVSVVGPTSAARADLERLALAKLGQRLRRERDR